MRKSTATALRRHAAFNPKAMRKHALSAARALGRTSKRAARGPRAPSTLPRRPDSFDPRSLRTYRISAPRDRASSLALRALWSLLALLALSVLATARLVAPDPRGVGTHEALGLSPCGFLELFGLPCPTCGLTTSFAHLARFELLPAVRAHVLGAPLFLATAALFVCCLRGALLAAHPSDVVARYRLDRAATLIALALLFAWSARLIALTR